MSCNPSVDASFGPWAPHCRGGTDFTILFELVWFSYVPCLAFILGAIRTLLSSSRRLRADRIARSGILRPTKLLAFIALVATNVVCIPLLAISKPSTCWRIAVGAASFELVASLCALLLSDRNHTRSPRPSTWVTFWLGVSCITQLSIARTRWLQEDSTAVAASYTMIVSLKALLVILENWEKRRLFVNSSDYAPEEVATPLSRLLFAWVLPLFRQGHYSILSLDHLMDISADLLTSKLPDSKPLQRTYKTLFQDLVMDMPRAFFTPVIARVFLIGFSLAQPFLVHTTLEYVVNPAVTRDDTRGSLLILGYILVFGGFALSNALFWYLVTRLKLRARSRLIELIYDCLYKSSGPHPGNNAAVSLMTIDVQVAMMGLDCFHDTWASVVQIAAAVGILGAYLSWACVAPVAACLGALVLTIPVVIYIQPAQATWNAATTQRLTLTTAVLNRLRDVRLLGIGGLTFSLIRRFREREIAKSSRFRKLLFLVIVLSQSPLGLSPLVTFAFYASIYNTNASSYTFTIQAFTALNLIGLIVTPFTNLLQALPIFGAGFASLARIQEFVDTARKEENNNRSITPCSTKVNALEAKDASFGWVADNFVVKDTSLEVANGDFLAITGPIASGKSTLLAGLLGLTPHSKGNVSRNCSRVSFCSQTPWIFRGTVRENIICGMDLEQDWYDKTIAACALAEDLDHWPRGDLQDVGNDGRNLSGGQRQRVALARAVYARNPVVFLDDPLSGLDSSSSEHIQREVLGQFGLLKRHRMTTIMVTNLSGCISQADQVVVLAKDGSFAEQGTPDSLSKKASNSLHNITSLRQLHNTRQKHPPISTQPGEDTGEGAVALAKEDSQRQNGDWSVYWYYIRASGRLSTLVFLLGSVGTAVGYQMGIAWIGWWSLDLLNGQKHSMSYHLGIYGLITALGGVALAANAGASMVFMVSRSASYLHTALLQAVARAPVSHFTSIDTGVTVNRFNQDLRLIDWELPLSMVNALGYMFICITQAIIIAHADRYMAISVIAAVGVLVIVQRFYLRTSRQLRLLDIEAKAPLYTNFHETIQGIPTIRAYGESFGQLLKQRQRYAVDRSQQPMFLLSIVQRWLSLAVDLIVSGLAMVLIILVIKDPSIGNISSLGVGLVNLTLFNQFLTYVISFWTELENALGAISRVKNFATKTPTASGHREDQTGCKSCQRNISLEHLRGTTGGTDIVFEGVTAHYETSAESTVHTDTAMSGPALDGVHLTIPARMRVAIVGRSGSGKSTLLSLLCRILSPSQGSIRIGGIDIASMDQEEVQQRLICVTQEFLFLPGFSLAENLNPEAMLLQGETPGDNIDSENDANNPEVIEALKDVKMWDAVRERNALNTDFDPAKWSTGELQLLNLARAVLKRRRRNNKNLSWKILLLDEVTSSVDRHTAVLIQQIIEREFARYTVIAVEHRLDSGTKGLDWIVRFDKGILVEQGKPDDLMLSQAEVS